ncbi:hypothetical protein AVEN_153000-1 [Araneus ventricosus]|uniref:Uncharacterized protein n=1 Tax=Araneus ventricosus TaxID=182803 RepID=A0A4Y2AD94_ARAVE|nr:hypothetical protein AVEN_153000-1 [Araneus ventricosus]
MEEVSKESSSIMHLTHSDANKDTLPLENLESSIEDCTKNDTDTPMEELGKRLRHLVNSRLPDSMSSHLSVPLKIEEKNIIDFYRRESYQPKRRKSFSNSNPENKITST